MVITFSFLFVMLVDGWCFPGLSMDQASPSSLMIQPEAKWARAQNFNLKARSVPKCRGPDLSRAGC